MNYIRINLHNMKLIQIDLFNYYVNQLIFDLFNRLFVLNINLLIIIHIILND